MAVRMINRSVVRLNDFIYGARKISCRCLHTTYKFDKNVQYCLSDIGEGIREVIVKSWYVNVNDKVAQFDNICEVESDKATVTITSRYDGVVKKLYYNVEDIAYVGKPLLDIDVPDGQGTTDEKPQVATNVSSDKVTSEITATHSFSQSDQTKTETWDKSLATPAVRRIAGEHKININDVKATGKNNRVLKEDILTHINNLSNTVTDTDKCQVKPLTRIMKIMIRTMTESNSIPTFGYSDEFDFSRLSDMRSRLFKSNGIKISYLPFILKAISKSLNKYPILNSSLDKDFKNLIYKPYHNIGVAIDSPSGLIVPNIKNVQQLSITEISDKIRKLQSAAYDDGLKPDELNDGTFSVSNIGAIGGISGIPCILPPEVVIVAIGKVRKLPRFDEHERTVPAQIVNFTFCADHRIIDGATVSRFSNLIKNYLENPELLLIEL